MMKKLLLLALATLLGITLSAQNLTPTVIASAGNSYSSQDLQVDMTFGETFITTLQASELILTQGFHQPAALLDGLGCTDSTACNYNANATQEDSTCVFPGCTALAACNYNSSAGCDDGSCVFPGCTDSIACNYNMTAGCDDGSCVFPGCTTLAACNYNSSAGCDDGSCVFPGNACDDGNAITVNDVVGFECVCAGEIIATAGCTDSTACNYNADATQDDSSCVFVGDVCDDSNPSSENDRINGDCICVGDIIGCNAPAACNYDATVTLGDFSCVFPGDACDDGDAATINDVYGTDCTCMGVMVMPGCTDSLACNYDDTATANDSTCYYPGDSCDDSNDTTINDVYGNDCVCSGGLSVDELVSLIQVYPNPATMEVMVTINGMIPSEVQIFDAAGRWLLTAQRTARIDVHALPAGHYTLRVLHDGSTWQKNLIKL